MLTARQESVALQSLDEDRLAIRRTIHAIPNYATYPSGSALQRQFRQLEIDYAHSRDIAVENKPIPTPSDVEVNMLMIAPKGVRIERSILVVSSVHTNETACNGTLEFLSRHACENPSLLKRLGSMLLFIDADPEGMALNGPSLMEGQPTLERYLFDGYRSHIQAAWDHTCDWLNHKSILPGTQAVERVIEEYSPNIIAPLHNAAMGNPHTFITRESPGLVADIIQLRRAVRRHYQPGKSDAPWIKELGGNTGVYGGVSARQAYDHFKKYNPSSEPTWPTAESSVGYHAGCVPGAFGIMDESPYFTTPSVADTELADVSMRETVEELNLRTGSIIDQAEEIRSNIDVEKLDPTYLPLVSSVDYLVKVYREELKLGTKDIPDTPVTKGAINDRVIRKLIYPGRVLGQAARLATLAGNQQTSHSAMWTLRRNNRELQARIGEIITSTPPEMVGMQVGTILLAPLAYKEGTLGNLVI